MNETRFDLNIEFGHVYSDESFHDEHRVAGYLAKDLIAKVTDEDKSVVSSLLVDEYNPSTWSLDIEDFIEELDVSVGVKPDFVVLESRLVQFADSFLNSLRNERWRESIRKWMEVNNKAPCALLVAIWSILRLGELSYVDKDFFEMTSENKVFFSKKIVNILPKRYESVEIKALDLIKNSKYHDLSANIEHIYY